MNFEDFSSAATEAMAGVLGEELPASIVEMIKASGRDFSFESSITIDSLDMLDVKFALQKKLGVQISSDASPTTMGELYDIVAKENNWS